MLLTPLQRLRIKLWALWIGEAVAIAIATLIGCLSALLAYLAYSDTEIVASHESHVDVLLTMFMWGIPFVLFLFAIFFLMIAREIHHIASTTDH